MKNDTDTIECCSEHHVHGDILEKLHSALPDEEKMSELADLFKVFGDITRIRILFVLLKSEACVCDIAETLNMTQSAISHQLKLLKTSKLVKARRDGKSIFYSLADSHVSLMISQGLEHIEE